MFNSAVTPNVDVVRRDLASMVDQMWNNKIRGVVPSVSVGFLHFNSCFLVNTQAIDSGTLSNAREALRKFEGYYVNPNPVGTGFELWIIPHWWKNPYK